MTIANKIEIKIDNSAEIVQTMQKQLQNGLMACGAIAEEYAKGDCP